MKMLRYVSLPILMMVVFVGCRHEQRPDDVMDERQMVEFLKDAYLLEGFYAVETNFNYDSLHPQMVASYDSLLARHNLTREDFERSVEYYTHHTHEYELIHQQVVDYLDSTIHSMNTPQ